MVDDEQRSEAEPEHDPRLTRFVQENVAVGEQNFAVFSMRRLVRAPDFRQATV
jgi:twitching motility protein PilI